jgi:hypothetical protein
LDRNRSSGRKSICRLCDNLKSRRYYEQNRDRVLTRIRARIRTNRKVVVRGCCPDCGVSTSVVGGRCVRCGQHAYYEQKREPKRPCEFCGKLFQRKRNSRKKSDPGRFCGNECRIHGMRLRGQSVPVPWRECVECGKVFIRRRPIARCITCRTQPRLPLPERVCIGCGIAFIPTHSRQRYCDKPCATRFSKREAKHRRKARGRSVERVYFRRICERDGWRCHICRRLVEKDKHVPHPLAPTRDHIIPLAEGGTHTPANVQLAHFICNSKRGARGGNEQLLLVG